NPDNSYTLLPSELQDLYITPAPDEHDFILTITAEAVEEANQNTIVDTQSLYVTIIPVNDDPFLSELADIETDEDVDVSFTIQGTDVDIETDGQELQFSCISSDEVLVLCDIVNLRGTVDMTLNLDVQDNRHGTADITVIVDDQFSNRAIDSRTFTLTVNPVPDTPNLTVSNSTGDEDTEIPINIESSLVDTDGSEQLVVFIDNIPDGSVITEPASIVNEHFVYTPDQLPSLQILPPLNSDEDFELFITAYTWEPDSSFTVNLDTIYVTVIEVADIPDVFAQGAEGNEDTIIPLTFGGALNDTDGSEVLFFGVNGIPEGSTVSQYYNYRDNAYILLPSQAEVFSVQPPLHDDNDFTLSISAISMENDTVIAISDTTISVIVHAVADVPDLAVTSAQGNEDTDIPLDIITSLVDDDGSESLFLTISGVPVEGTLSAGTDLGNGTYELLIGDLLNLSIHPPEDINEDIDLTVRSITTEVNGGDQTYNELTLPVDVIPVNDFPQMTIADQVTNEDSDFSIPISAYDPDIITDDQIMNFSVSSANETLVTASVVNNRYLDGSVNDAEIWFDVHDDEYGETTISVTVDDDNGGVIVVDFNVLVNPVNDEPSFVVGPDITLDEDDASSDPLHPAEVKIYPGWASEIDVGPSNEDDGHTAGIESNQFPTFTLTTDNDELFNVLPTIDGSGELVFQQEINIYGSAEVSIILVDNGGIEFDGDDTFPVQSFTITINPINDAPYLGNITDRSVLEDNILQLTFEELFSPDDFLEWFVLEVDGDHLTFGANGSEHVIMSSVDGDLISFSPTAEWYGTEEIRVFVTDGAYIDSRHLNVGVQPVNDIPSFVSGENVTVLEDSGVYSQLWATDLNMGPLNESDGHTEGIESNQHPSFVLTAENSNLFIDQPSIDSEGILTFSTAENANGTASVSVVMNDNGGTLNGGIDQTLPIEFTINVSPVNDDPILAELSDIETDEDVNVSIQVSGSDVDMETNGQELTFSCTSSDESLAVCSIEEDQQRGVVTKQLVLTVQENMHGTATIDVMVNDGQGRAIAADNFVLTVNAVPDIPLLSVTD
ncbi:MAG: Ig-like domain-containing protein, partial [Fidelibacterota bacterium]